MKNSSHQIKNLLIKYRENRCTRNEYEELIRLARHSGNESVIKEVMRQDWDGQYQELTPEPVILLQPRRRKWSPGLKIAASLVLLIAAGFVLFQWLSHDQIAYATGNGEVMEITLPDGSVVTLNANSNLTWVSAKSEADDRLVELEGEAFFNVVKEKASANDGKDYRGFQVRTPKMTVHVLGTSFNVAARKENTEVFLEEGSVELQMPDVGNEVRRLAPGDKVILDNQTGTVTEKNSEKIATSASWVNGILNYHDKSMGEVLQNLSELFGVEITCEDPVLQNKKINLGVPYMDWENTRRALEMAIEVQFSKEGNQYIVVQSK